MNLEGLSELMQAYAAAPHEFHATSYWDAYEKEILDTISKMDIEQIRSGKYPILATFGFSDVVNYFHPHSSFFHKTVVQYLYNHVVKNRFLPYGMNLSDIKEMAYRHSQLIGQHSGAQRLDSIEVSSFGNPADIFEIQGKKVTIAFLDFYIRYCFAHKHIGFRGDETIVELGPGSGYQVEILKKLYPKMTILCFDMPLQIFLCEKYLSCALGGENVVGISQTLNWTDINKNLEKGKVHFLGNWQFPLLAGFKFTVFWNAASFGEMELDIVKNYLSYVIGNVKWIYLLQVRNGKEITGKNHVTKPIVFEDYDRLLSGYKLQEQQDAYYSLGKIKARSGGYFEAIWMKE